MAGLVNRLWRMSPHEIISKIKKRKKNKKESIKTANAVSGYLKGEGPKKLQIGCGYNPAEGWFNTDLEPTSNEIFYMDASLPYQIEDNSFDFIFSEHIFEHLTFEQECNMIRECQRILKPGGVMRMAIPHAGFLFNLYQNPEIPVHKNYVNWAMNNNYECKKVLDVVGGVENTAVYVINNFYRDWGHEVLHDYASISGLLTKLNFREVKKKEVGESDYPELKGIEKHGGIIAPEFNLLETLVVEAVK